jgi:hypothetical protein
VYGNSRVTSLRRWSTLSVGALALALGCNPSGTSIIDPNASNPAGNPTLARSAQNSPSVVALSNGVFGVGFQDYSGTYVESPPGSGNLALVSGIPTMMGYAYSVDDGAHWTRESPLTSVALACATAPGAAQPGCIQALVGPPALASAGDSMFYATAASTLQANGGSTASDTIALARSQDGVGWSDVSVALRLAVKTCWLRASPRRVARSS